jgi:hypothetical protein
LRQGAEIPVVSTFLKVAERWFIKDFVNRKVC